MAHKTIKLLGAVATALALMASNSYADEVSGTQLVNDLNGVFGKHEGARAVHAKGIVLEGNFTPARSAKSISSAEHFKSSVPVTVRFSDFAGIPDLPDNHGLAAPRGIAIKFHLSKGAETDLVAHSFNGFPAPNAEEFHNLLNALAKSGPDAAKPTALDNYLESHAVAKNFLTAVKPAPVSFGTLPYYGVNSFKFTNTKGKSVFARYQILPVAGNVYLDDEAAKKADANYLVNEIKTRVQSAPVKFKLVAQIAEKDDVIDNPSIAWPDSRRTVELGTVEIKTVSDDAPLAGKKIVFFPGALTSGIEAADPMISTRSQAYAESFKRRSE